MGQAQLLEKIDQLPLTLQAQVADFVEFLLQKHGKGESAPSDEPELTAEQKAELDRRYQAYLNDPASTVNIEAMKNRLMKKYGLQH